MTHEPIVAAEIVIQLNGAALEPAIMQCLDECVVEDDLGRPAMFTLRFNDPELQLIDGKRFALGAEVKLAATDAKGRRKLLMVGEITALEPIFEQYEVVLVVRGYDRSHRLHRGHTTRTFLKQSDGAIVKKLAGAQSLSANAQPGEQHEYLIQHGQTDMQFLRARAARLGYRVSVADKALRFGEAEKGSPAAPELVWGLDLISFRARLSAVAQVNEVEVRGWDPKTKQPIVGTATSPAQFAKLQGVTNGGAEAQKALGGKAKLTITDQYVRSAGEARKLAQAMLDERSGDFLSAEGVCYGEPTLRAGLTVPVKGVGKFSGSYFVTATRHVYNAYDGYRTTFFVNGRRTGGLLAAIEPQAKGQTMAGVVTAVVTNLNDPERQGRVKLKFPWLDERQESDWVRVATPGAGPGRGLMDLPEVHDEVLVAFEHGDINRPYVLGGLWNGKDKPPLSDAVKAGKVERRTLKTRAGHSISIDDAQGKGTVEIVTADGQKVVLEDQKPGKVTVSSGGALELKAGGGSLTISPQGAVELKSSSGAKLAITPAGGLELTAGPSKLAFSPAGAAELSSTMGKLAIGPANVTLQANALMDVKAGAILNIQGTLVKIN